MPATEGTIRFGALSEDFLDSAFKTALTSFVLAFYRCVPDLVVVSFPYFLSIVTCFYISTAVR